jgi:hypothetical protein
MNFEHLIAINDSSVPELPFLSRQQLWRGLVIRAEKPQLSVLGLDACEILEEGEGYICREQRFGDIIVRDRVSFVHMETVTYDTEQGENLPAGRLVMKIEEPQSGSLFVRFTYSTHESVPSLPADNIYGEYLKQAYTQADIDTIAMIRELVFSGLISEE